MNKGLEEINYFDYECQNCHDGTIKQKLKENYTVKIFEENFKVSYALVGICDNCGAKNYAGKEIERWKDIYLTKKKNQIIGDNYT